LCRLPGKKTGPEDDKDRRSWQDPPASPGQCRGTARYPTPKDMHLSRHDLSQLNEAYLRRLPEEPLRGAVGKASCRFTNHTRAPGAKFEQQLASPEQ
jgi:hypothetical protein